MNQLPISDFRPPTSKTRTLAIIGDPIEHSLTPRIQNAALQAIGADIVNVAFRVEPKNLRDAVLGAKSLGFLGLMVTIPHKEAVLECCDELDESARLMGAANLLHFRGDGKTLGYSSDGWAALKSLGEAEISVANGNVVILGGGGAARSLALTFAHAGARDIVVLNRTAARAQKIVDEIKSGSENQSATALELNNEILCDSLIYADLLVNSTSIGMQPRENETPVPTEILQSLQDKPAVYDIVYNPLETKLLREARETGCQTIDGLGMLIYTNVRAVEICAGLEISAQIMRGEALQALAKR